MIITIGRQHGSDGLLVAQRLADKLSIPCYSKEIIDRTARDSHFSADVIRSYDEKHVSSIFVSGPHFFGSGESYQLDRKIAEAQFEAIRNLADEGDAVFIGRCADYVLRKRSDLVRVFITADLPSRIRALMEHGDVT